MKKVLFICSQNRLRSPTAERVFSRQPGLSVRSAGLNPSAVHHVSREDLEWADYIFLMENWQKEALLLEFEPFIKHQKMIVLNIPDVYDFMDENLIAILKERVPKYLPSIN